jgi:hypothetical protein
MSRIGALFGRHDDPVYRITNAPVGLDDDQGVRVRNYVTSMVLRIVFIVAAVLASGWLRWTFAACAVFIPYFAVVIANGGRERSEHVASMVPPPAPALPPAPTTPRPGEPPVGS